MIQIVEQLSQKVWSYADNVLPANPFMFNGPGWVPGDYILKNMSGSNVTVVLFHQTYVVPAHTNWRFMANRQLESVVPATGASAVGKPRSVNAGEVAVGADGTAATASPGTSASLPTQDRGLHPEPEAPKASTGPTGQPGLDTAGRSPAGANSTPAGRVGPPSRRR